MIAVIVGLIAYILLPQSVVVDLFVLNYYVLVVIAVFVMIALNVAIVFIVAKMNVPANYAKSYY